MSYSALTQPGNYMAGYSSVPLRLNSSDSQDYNYYKYVTNIVFSSSTFSSASNVSYDNNTYTEVTFTKAHSFEIGDVILLDDASGEYQGYYNVMSIPSTTKVVINLSTGAALGASEFYRVIKYKMSPDIQGEAKIDLANTLKDFVTENLQDTNEIFAAPNTKFEYGLMLGQESNYVFNFEDNGFVGGNTSFWNSSLPSTYTATTMPFQIGDQVEVLQDVFEWDYNDNFWYSGELGFTGSTPHNFKVDQPVNITGQVTVPGYNGESSVRTVVDLYSFTVYKTFTSSTPVEPGTAFGVPRPTYNTTATITDIYWDATYGVVVVTDIPFDTSSSPLPGQMKLINDEKSTTVNDLEITGLTIYNARIETLEYGFSTDQFDPYVCQDRNASLNNISTILGNTERYRIEPTTKSWLLVHGDKSTLWNPLFTFYNSSNSVVSEFEVDLSLTYGSSVNINSYTNSGGFLRINLAAAHGLSIDDRIMVTNAISTYNGPWIVTKVNSSTSITVNAGYAGNILNGAEYIRKITGGDYDDYYFPVGIDQLTANTNTTLVSGSELSAVTSDVSYYKVELESRDTLDSNPIYFEVNTDCSRYEVYHLTWKDAFGSWLSYPFKYISEDRTEVERKDYYKTEGTWDLTDNTFGYDTYGRGQKSFFIRTRDKFVLNSGWVEEFENELIKDLMSSASVYLQRPDGVLLAANIINKDIQLKKKQSDYLWNYRFEVQASINENRF